MDAKGVNDYLKRWGTNPHGQPIMQLVWSDDARELRLGTFNDYYGHIFLRTVTGVRSVPKYSWIASKWVLERWFPPERVLNSELPESRKGSYEPIYIFQDKHGNSLPLNLRIVELICSAMFNRPPTRQQVAEALLEGLNKEDDEMQKYFEDALELSVIGTQLRLGEATAYGPHKGGR